MQNQIKNIHCFISGRVQGVFFRASTQQKANEFNIKGWVRNLRDGRVEVMASGKTATMDLFLEWLHQGPPMAQVDNIEFDQVTDLEEQVDNFMIK